MSAARPAEGGVRFLASVRSAEEARVALAGGADIIDAKEPLAGALGAVALDEIAHVVQVVKGERVDGSGYPADVREWSDGDRGHSARYAGRSAGDRAHSAENPARSAYKDRLLADTRASISATIGDCDLSEAAERVAMVAETGVDYVKIGLFGEVSAAAFDALEHCSASGIRLIAVMLADRAPDFAQIRRLAEAGFSGVMLDTAGKGDGSLLSHMSMAQLTDFIGESCRFGLLAGLAGSLKAEDARALMPLRPDVLGFRGALCAGGARGETLEFQRVTAMRRLIRDSAGAEMIAGMA